MHRRYRQSIKFSRLCSSRNRARPWSTCRRGSRPRAWHSSLARRSAGLPKPITPGSPKIGERRCRMPSSPASLISWWPPMRLGWASIGRTCGWSSTGPFLRIWNRITRRQGVRDETAHLREPLCYTPAPMPRYAAGSSSRAQSRRSAWSVFIPECRAQLRMESQV